MSIAATEPRSTPGDRRAAAKSPRSRPWIFITWYPYCRRSDRLAEQLGARSYLVHYLRFKSPAVAPVKYLLQAMKTASILLRDRPSIVLTAVPPVVSALVIWCLSGILRYRLVIDAHSGTFQHSRWLWSLPVQRFLSRRAVATVVTSDHMANVVRSWGATATMVQELSLDLRPQGVRRAGEAFRVVFICTYSVDEPVDAVLEAARRLPDVSFTLTGDPSYARRGLRESLPPNVKLTGFIPDNEYLDLLRGADALLVLTLEDHTMQRGGYEAMALEKPLITSNWALLREVFGRGTVHVDNTPETIAAAVRTVQADPDFWGREMREQKKARAGITASQVGRLLALCESADSDRSLS